MWFFSQSDCTRRQNPDGTTDSICRKCFVTVITAVRTTDLDRAEQDHTCDPSVLDYWRNLIDSNSAQNPPQ